MPRLRRETRRFKRRALNSLFLAIELFNRPHDAGRAEGVLILLQHAFEMLLKAAIYEQRGTIYPRGERISYRFTHCLGIAKSDLGIVNNDEKITLSILDGLRNCATHNLLDLTEQALYIHAQAGVSLFGQILGAAFGEHLATHLPSRVLPISTQPPRDMLTFLDREFSQIQGLLGTRTRRKAEARGSLRHLMVMESNLSAGGDQPTDSEIDQVITHIQRGESWQSLFPGIAGLRLDTQGHGLTVSIRFTREAGAAPVQLIRPGEPGAGEAPLIREVNLLDRYSMGIKDLAQKLGQTVPKTGALVRYLSLQNDEQCFMEFPIGRTVHRRYSPIALERLRQALRTADINAIWKQHGSIRGPASR